MQIDIFGTLYFILLSFGCYQLGVYSFYFFEVLFERLEILYYCFFDLEFSHLDVSTFVNFYNLPFIIYCINIH